MLSNSLLLAAAAAAGGTVPLDYVAYWPLQTDADDETGTYNGTEHNISYVSDGDGGYAADFNGTNGYIDSNFHSLSNSDPFYLCFFCKPDTSSSSATRVLFGAVEEQGSYDSVISVNNNLAGTTYPSLQFRSTNNGGTVEKIEGAASLTDGNPHFIEVYYDGTDLYFYIDEVSIGSVDITGQTFSWSAQDFAMGAMNSRGNLESWYNGWIQHFFVYDRVPTASEREALANKQY